MRIFALLVGINDYGPEVGKLRGAVNDVGHYRDFLTDHFDPAQLNLQVLTDADATRENIIAGFREFLSQATEDDVALFQYAGHGARWKSAPEFSQFFPDGFDEGLICYDSRRTPDAYDLADKELAVLLAELSKNNPHIAVILDSCHSGSGTRSADDIRQFKTRASHTIKAARPLESYLGGYYSGQQAAGASILPPGSQHILLAACDRRSQAFESHQQRGIFSETLLDVLQQVGTDLSYADLFLKVRSLVRVNAYGQSPQFEARLGFNAYRGFLNRLASRRGRRFTVENPQYEGWRFKCGTIGGLPADLDTTVEMQLFDPEQPDVVLGQAITTSIGLTESQVEISGFKPDYNKIYDAEITSMPAPGLTVYLDGLESGVETMLERTGSGDMPISFVWDTESNENLKYSVTAGAEGFDIRFLADQRLIKHVAGLSTDAADETCSALNRIANWEHLINLQNLSPMVDTSPVRFCFSENHADGSTTDHEQPEITFDIVNNNGSWSEVSGRIRGQNTTDQRLNLMLVFFDEKFGIRALYNEPHEKDDDWFTFQLDVGDDFYEVMNLSLDEDEGDQATYTLMLFVSKEKVDDFLINQEPIEAALPAASRGVSFKKKVREVTWFTKKIELNLVRQTATLHADTDAVLADERIRIKAHPALSAGASMLPAADITRGAGSADFTRALADQGFELLNFSTTRGQSQSILELHNIQNRDSLKEHPLEIELDFELTEDELILPLVFDGEHILLAGDVWQDNSGKTQVAVRDIPEDCSGGRSAFSAFRMYFMKTVCGFKRTGSLCSLTIDDRGKIRRSTSGLGERVNKAERILILLHGIAGDSRWMVEQMRTTLRPDGEESKPPFDLVLGFDFESINTPLEESAAELKELLKTKGIDENSDQQITMVAHSIGGLLARWFVEQEGGNQIVDHLVLCGTPNEGSPFGMVALAPAALKNLIDLAVNSIPPLAATPLKGLQSILAMTSLTTTLGQLDQRSDFMSSLNSSDDPGIRYTVLAGDISSYDVQSDEEAGRFRRLMLKIGASDTFNKLFGDSPHDVAVSVDSMRAVLDNRSPAPVKQNLGCHHLNYFSSDPGNQCLAHLDWDSKVAPE